MLIQGVEASTRVNVRCDIHRQKYVCRKHVHHFAELVLVLDGRLTVTVNDTKQTAEKNQFIFVFPFQRHEYTSDEVSHFMICTFPLSLLQDFAAKSSGRFGKSSVFNASNIAVELFREKLIHVDNVTPYGVYTCLNAMLDDLTSQIELTECDIDSSAMDKLVYYVSRNYKNPLPLSSVAQALGYSPNYLSHCISKTLSMNYRTFLGSTRAEYAKLLLNTKQSIIDIALECGYPNVRSFQRHFKDLVGLSPSEYRKKRRSQKNSVVVSEVTEYRIRKDILM